MENGDKAVENGSIVVDTERWKVKENLEADFGGLQDRTKAWKLLPLCRCSSRRRSEDQTAYLLPIDDDKIERAKRGQANARAGRLGLALGCGFPRLDKRGAAQIFISVREWPPGHKSIPPRPVLVLISIASPPLLRLDQRRRPREVVRHEKSVGQGWPLRFLRWQAVVSTGGAIQLMRRTKPDKLVVAPRERCRWISNGAARNENSGLEGLSCGWAFRSRARVSQRRWRGNFPSLACFPLARCGFRCFGPVCKRQEEEKKEMLKEKKLGK
eukprot:gene348-740_t